MEFSHILITSESNLLLAWDRDKVLEEIKFFVQLSGTLLDMVQVNHIRTHYRPSATSIYEQSTHYIFHNNVETSDLFITCLKSLGISDNYDLEQKKVVDNILKFVQDYCQVKPDSIIPFRDVGYFFEINIDLLRQAHLALQLQI